MKIAISIISFLLDGILSNYLPTNGIFMPLFTLMCLIVIYPHFNDNSWYYKYAFILGIFYDIVYTGTFIFYASVFLLISFIISKLNRTLTESYINLIIISIVSIIIFRTITYLLIVLTGNLSFDFYYLFRGIYSSILINVIYVVILKFITSKFKRKRNSYY